ncbi:MAG: phosphotransferase [Acidimicrobiales bacterium]
MTLGMISSPADLTPDWLTELLRSTGDLDPTTSVATVQVAEFGSAESMMSSLSRLALTYDGATNAPSSLIVKLASSNDGMRFIAGMFHFYEREIRFYNDLLGQAPIETPRCLHSEIYPDDQGFLLVLEEVIGHRQVDQLEGMNFDDAATTLEALADLHAPFWGTDLSGITDTMLPFGSEALQQLIPPKVCGDWIQVRPMLVDDLPAEVVALLDRLPDVFVQIMNDMMGDDTLIHGDCRADNMLFNADGSVLMLDFQLMAVCNGMVDASYLISQSLHAEAQARAAELIDVYLARIASKGIEVDREQAMSCYRAATIFHLGIGLGVLSAEGLHERGEQLGRVMFERGSREILRTGGHLHYP